MSQSKPKVGDWIRHNEPDFKRCHEGEVILVISSQFVYRIAGGDRRMCLFSEDWIKIPAPRAKRSE